MFRKEYVFETIATKNSRFYRKILFIILGFLICFTLLCLYIPFYATDAKQKASEAFFNKAPDVIAVYTGDFGRIDYALQKTEQYPSAKIFISGVDARNNLKILLEKQGKGISVESFLDQESHHIELDYFARNTVENAIATLNFLQESPQLKNVLIVSSDYHILRISLILNTLLEDHHDYQFYYESVPSDYTSWRNIRILMKEVYKIIKTSTFLLFWDKETTLNL